MFFLFFLVLPIASFFEVDFNYTKASFILFFIESLQKWVGLYRSAFSIAKDYDSDSNQLKL